MIEIEPGAPTSDRENPYNMTQDDIQISDLTLDGGYCRKRCGVQYGARAEYGIHAAAITRSVFRQRNARDPL